MLSTDARFNDESNAFKLSTMDTVHTRMKAARERVGLSQQAVADRIVSILGHGKSLSLQAVAQWERDQPPTLSNFTAWCEAVGADPSEVLSGRFSHRVREPQAISYEDLDGYALVPRYDITAGMGLGRDVHSEQVVDHLAFREDWLRGLGLHVDRIACITCRGVSMEPTIGDGAIALLDLARRDGDGVFAVSRPNHGDGQELVVKRIEHRLDGSTHVISDNRAKYDPIVIPPGKEPDISVIGRVVWAGGVVR